MSHFRYLIAGIVLLIAITSGAVGCAATPQDRWYQQREALNTANQIYLANVPQMEDQQIVRHGELLQTARAALVEAKTHLPGGGSVFDSAMDVVEAILKQLVQTEVNASTQEEPAHDLR